MSELNESAASLRFFGDDLDPDEVTQLLGHAPSNSERVGEMIVRAATKHKRIAQTGGWRLSAERRKPGDLDAQISGLLDLLTDDIAIWSNLTRRFRADMFCCMFMIEFNEGTSLSPTRW